MQREVASRFGSKPASREARTPIISFSFDDFPRSALTIAGDILASHNIQGTYYASLGLMGETTAVGKIFELQDLESLVEAGHELACHTYEHTP